MAINWNTQSAPTPTGINWTGSTTSPIPQQPQSAASQIWGALGNAGNTIKNTAIGALNTGIQGYNEAANAGNQITTKGISGIPSALAQLFEGGAGVAAGAIGVPLSTVAPVVKPTLGAGVTAAGNALANTPFLQAYGKDTVSLGNQQLAPERALQDIQNVDTIAGAGAAPESVVPGLGLLKSGATSLKGAIDSFGDEPPGGSAPVASTAKPVTDPNIIRGAQDWQKPAQVQMASFNAARDVLAKAPDTPQFLAEQGLSPYDHIENGRYSTEDAATALRDTAGKMSADGLRPSLQVADYSTPKTPVSEITSKTISDIKKTKGSTPGAVAQQVANAEKEGAILEQKYPNGMSLENMHDEKITYAGNGKYSPVGDPAVNNTASMNRAFGRVLAKQVETKAPADVPVGDLNKYLTKYYQAADYLDALNTKKAPVSTLQYIAHKGAQVMGAGVGHAIGGGLLGGVGGYMIGGALEHALENMTTPLRASFIRNLEITHPEVVNKLQSYIQNQQGVLPRLPAATDSSPIPMGPESNPVTPSVAPFAEKVVPTKENPLPRDPKTGRVMSQYKSTPR